MADDMATDPECSSEEEHAGGDGVTGAQWRTVEPRRKRLKLAKHDHPKPARQDTPRLANSTPRDWAAILVPVTKRRLAARPRLFQLRDAVEAAVPEAVIMQCRYLDGGRILVAVTSEAARQKVLQISHLAGQEVKGRLPGRERIDKPVRGVIQNVPQHFSLRALKIELAKAGVAEVAEFGPTTVVLTFPPGHRLPAKVTLESDHAVHPYVAKPRQCWKCFGFFHDQSRCTGPARCWRCGSEEHLQAKCNRNVGCANCKGRHWTGDRACPEVKRASEIARLVQHEHLPFREAATAATAVVKERSTLPHTSTWGRQNAPAVGAAPPAPEPLPAPVSTIARVPENDTRADQQLTEVTQ